MGYGLSHDYVIHPADVAKLGVYRARTQGGDTRGVTGCKLTNIMLFYIVVVSSLINV
jgi:hypothetical protein